MAEWQKFSELVVPILFQPSFISFLNLEYGLYEPPVQASALLRL